VLTGLGKAAKAVAASAVWLGLFVLSSCFVVVVMVLALFQPKRSVQP
jgi:hypothetical protein